MRLRTAQCSSYAVVRAGFTLMELLVVVAILLVLTSVAVPIYLNYLEDSKVGVVRVRCNMLAGELKLYAASHDFNYPEQNDWSALLMEQNPPLDVWGNPFQWRLEPVGNAESVVNLPLVWSVGRDGINGTDDDIYGK